MGLLKPGDIGELHNGWLKALDCALHHIQQGPHRLDQSDFSWQLHQQGRKQAFNVGKGRFQVVGGRLDEVVQVSVDVHQLPVVVQQFLVSTAQLFIADGQLFVQPLHQAPDVDLCHDVGGHGGNGHCVPLRVAQRLIHEVDVHGGRLAGS